MPRAYAAFSNASYRRYAIGGFVSVVGGQMLAVALGWEMYARTHSATLLGLVGLMEALPMIVLVLPAGHVADKFNRKRVAVGMISLVALFSAGLAVCSQYGAAEPSVGVLRAGNGAIAAAAALLGERAATFTDPIVPVMLALVMLTATAQTLYGPARVSMLPSIVPAESFANAVTWNSSIWQGAAVVGPMLGGVVIAVTDSYALVYLIDALCCASCALLLLSIPYRQSPRAIEEPTLRTLAAGIHFVRKTKIILATITLDLFAVLLGGATALLPIFAKDILNVGAAGLGWLRAAPSMGAVAMAMLIAHAPPMRRAGRGLLVAVAGFGAATIVFGLSHIFWLSMAMLIVAGAFDQVSVVVRHTLVQVLTPDALRGRVSAVNYMFIGASNELGAFESGVTAAMFGPVISVVAGGIGTIAVVMAVAIVWPAIRRFGSLQEAQASNAEFISVASEESD